MYNRPLHHELFLELLRSALWDKVPDFSQFRNLDETIWEKVLVTAQKQALLGVCYPALNLMPSDCRPPKSIYIIGAAKANYIRQDNKKKLRLLAELLNLFENNDIHPVVMKGFSSAILYPEPDLRICGDIDLFIPDKYEESVKLIESLGFETSFTHKHHKFYYDEVLIELHHDIISPPLKKLHQYSVHEVEYSGVKFKVFDETTTGILLLTHAVTHLIGPGLGFRHLCDWVLFNKNYSKNIDNSYFNNYIKENSLIRFLTIFNELSNTLKITENLLFIGFKKRFSHNDVYSLEKDMFMQGDCGYGELLYRNKRSKILTNFRVLLRFLRALKYGFTVSVSIFTEKIRTHK